MVNIVLVTGSGPNCPRNPLYTLLIWRVIQRKGIPQKKGISLLSHGVFLSNLELIFYDNGFIGARNFRKFQSFTANVITQS